MIYLLKMKRELFLAAFLLLAATLLSGCSLKSSPSALQISTTPVANVFIEGKTSGKTPYQNSQMKAGEYTIKLIPEDTNTPLSFWEGKVKLNPGVLTLVNYEFGTTENTSSGEILTLEKGKDKKKAGLTVISDPDGVMVSVDGETKGFTPITLEDISIGDHQILLSKAGFKERLIKAKTVMGFKLVANVKLSQEESLAATPEPSTSVTPTSFVSPTPSKTSGVPAGSQVKIKETPTGWLRVRAEASTASEEIARVNPGEQYPLLDEKNGWYQIEYETGKKGWISAQYADKL